MKTLYNFLQTLGVGFFAMTLIVAVAFSAAVGVATFAAWDLSVATRWMDWTTLRVIVAVGFVIAVWFTLSKEGRSTWLD